MYENQAENVQMHSLPVGLTVAYRHKTNVATTLTSFGKSKLKLGLARQIEFVPCPPHSCQKSKSIEAGTAWPLNFKRNAVSSNQHTTEGLIAMPRLSIASLILIVALDTTYAQTGDSLHVNGRKTLTFSFAGFDLSGGLGGKYWHNDRQFLRLSVDGSYSKETTDRQLVDSNSVNLESSMSEIGASLGLANRFNTIGNFVPYAGAAIGYRSRLEKYTRTTLSGAFHYSEHQTTIFGNVFLGVEYFVGSNFSISGEQRVELAVGRSDHGRRVFRISNSTSSLMLSVYL